VSIHTVAIVGIGLIGGSLAAAWRASGFAQRIVALDPNDEAAEFALSRGLVDDVVSSVPQEATLVAICTPSDLVAEQVRALADHSATLFDVGSVKGPILEALNDHGVPPNFVPSHPIAGSEQSGPQGAAADLFRGANVVLTPTQQTHADAVALVTVAWEAVGARCVGLDARVHDRMLARTSHLPHLLAFAFMQQIETQDLGYAGGGFRDFTRIAQANPELWWRILSMNKAEVIAQATQFQSHLAQFVDLLNEDDQALGLGFLQAAADRRAELDAVIEARKPATDSSSEENEGGSSS